MKVISREEAAAMRLENAIGTLGRGRYGIDARSTKTQKQAIAWVNRIEQGDFHARSKEEWYVFPDTEINFSLGDNGKDENGEYIVQTNGRWCAGIGPRALIPKTWGEIRMQLERQAREQGVLPWNVISERHDFTEDGILITYSDGFTELKHTTLLKGWTAYPDPRPNQ